MAAKIKIKKVDDKFVATVSDFIILANRSYSYEIVGKGYTEEYARAAVFQLGYCSARCFTKVATGQ